MLKQLLNKLRNNRNYRTIEQVNADIDKVSALTSWQEAKPEQPRERCLICCILIIESDDGLMMPAVETYLNAQIIKKNKAEWKVCNLDGVFEMDWEDLNYDYFYILELPE